MRLVVAAVMLAMGLVMVVPAFAAPGGGATVTPHCFDWKDAAGVEGTECDRKVDTPSNNNNVNYSQLFTPDVQGEGGTVDQGAQHNLGEACTNPAYDSCNTTYTPSGNASRTLHSRE